MHHKHAALSSLHIGILSKKERKKKTLNVNVFNACRLTIGGIDSIGTLARSLCKNVMVDNVMSRLIKFHRVSILTNFKFINVLSKALIRFIQL